MPQKRKPKKPPKKRRPGAREIAVIHKLQGVSEERRPFFQLSRELVGEVLEQYASGGGLVVEVGAGDGQLRPLVPTALLAQMVHTEPLALGVKRFANKFPDSDVRRAPAERLPFADGEVETLVALCVFDVIEDGAALARECARVLKPGGHLIHFLDMSAEPNASVARLKESGLMVIPNIFSDPCEQPWPEDMFVLPTSRMQLLVHILERAKHPFAPALSKYLAVFLAAPFSAARAAGAYTYLWENGQPAALSRLLQTASELATPEEQARLGLSEGYPASAARLLDARLQGWFCPESGFELALSEMRTKRGVVPRLGRSQRYLSMAAGHIRELPEPPVHLLAGPAPTLAEDELLVEQSIYVYAARRLT